MNGHPSVRYREADVRERDRLLGEGRGPGDFGYDCHWNPLPEGYVALAAGARVRVSGSHKKAGKEGVIVAVKERGWITVELDDGSEIKARNKTQLELVAAPPAAVVAAAEPSPDAAAEVAVVAAPADAAAEAPPPAPEVAEVDDAPAAVEAGAAPAVGAVPAPMDVEPVELDIDGLWTMHMTPSVELDRKAKRARARKVRRVAQPPGLAPVSVLLHWDKSGATCVAEAECDESTAALGVARYGALAGQPWTLRNQLAHQIAFRERYSYDAAPERFGDVTWELTGPAYRRFYVPARVTFADDSDLASDVVVDELARRDAVVAAGGCRVSRVTLVVPMTDDNPHVPTTPTTKFWQADVEAMVKKSRDRIRKKINTRVAALSQPDAFSRGNL